ncbi:MAG: 3-ketoacyl-ACP reductase [Rhodospirillaceae bacterium]|jgi:NAD(P)-dependent dehydrogenase (short-subunit alcohol dehydrogenase family)|nr:3-ketoacyl-ACP reductase [Rhodospirillaceae bacterium]
MHGDEAKTALVTGGRRGIGRGIALALAEAGFDIALLDVARDADAEAALAEIAARGRRSLFVAGDIADIASHAAVAETIWRALGPLTCLVNNAGVSVLNRGDLLEVTPESYDRCLDINLRGSFFLTQTIAKRMLADPAPAWHRSIVNITSVSAEVVSISRGEYCISKAGAAMMTKLFAVRLAETGIGVYEVRPGIIRTDMTKVSEGRLDQLIQDGISPIKRWGEAADVAKTVVTAAEGHLPFAVGQALLVDGGLTIRTL